MGRRLTAEERHGGGRFQARFTEERSMMRRRVADIVPAAVEQDFDRRRRLCSSEEGAMIQCGRLGYVAGVEVVLNISFTMYKSSNIYTRRRKILTTFLKERN